MKITVEINKAFAKIICKGRETTVVDLRHVDYIQPEDCNRIVDAWLKVKK